MMNARGTFVGRPSSFRSPFLGAAVGLLLLGMSSGVVAQIPAGTTRSSRDSVARPESVAVVPGAHYRAGALHRWLFGAHYRDLWTAPLTVPVLALDRYAGGLRPLARGGSMQTKALRFQGADGREYVFRSTDKDPSRSLPAELRGTYADRIVRDLISAEHPGAGLIVARLADAAGVLHARPQLVALPDDSLLGAFRSEFAGLIGMIEVRPTDDPDNDGVAFAGATRVIGSERLLERVTEHGEEMVDAHAYLTARLLDVLVGDWDRHPDQWRWARFGDGAADQWTPIPRDRDWALVKLDGLVWSLARFMYPFPQFVSFERDYSDPVWLTWSGRLLDRRFLSVLDRPTWDSVAMDLQRRISDDVIDEALQRLPGALAASNLDYVRRNLISRRDHLREFAARFYALLSDEAEVHATDEDDVVDVTRLDERYTRVTVRQRNKAGVARGRVSWQRRFDAEDTREIRIYLHKGDDRVVVAGVPESRTNVRVVGGGGRNTFVDSTETRDARDINYYDANAASGPHEIRKSIDRGTYVPPKTRRGWIDPPRDWGSRWTPVPWASYTPDAGLFLGGGPRFERYGFRLHPYAYKVGARAGFAPGVNRWRAELDADIRRTNSGVYATLLARYSELDIMRFHGFGNETPKLGSKEFHRVDFKAFAFEPMMHVPLRGALNLGIGAAVRHSATERDSGRFISTFQPYGTGGFGQIGARAGLTFDTRDREDLATRGVYASVQGASYPEMWSVKRPYSELRSQLSTYLAAPLPLEPVLALRAGGDKLWGRYPFFDAAFIGGASTVRGWREQRFAGDGSLYGNAELRVFLTKIFLLLPADLGAFGLADAGRVYLPGEQSDVWHSGFGGGLWVSFLGRANTFSVAAAHSREGTSIYFRSGVLY